MDHPFKTTPLHILPHDDLSKGGAYYLSRKWLPGMMPLQDLVQLYGYPMRGVQRKQMRFTAPNLSRYDTVNIGLGTGGVIQEWWPGEVAPQIVNNAGEAGRSINQTLFCLGKGYHANPTMAGDKFDIFFPDHVDPKVQEPPNNWSQHTLLHGSRMIGMRHDGNLLHTRSVPLEWDPDGTWPSMKHNHGGSSVTAREYEDVVMDMEVDFHWRGAGLHRFRSICELPEVDPKWNLKWGSLGLFLCFGFDEIFAYNAEAHDLTKIRGAPLCGSYGGRLLDWFDGRGHVIGKLSGPHGREAETRQNVLYGLRGEEQVTVSSIFMDGPESTRMRIDPKPDHLPPLGEILAPAAFAASFNDKQERQGFRKHITIGGGTGGLHNPDQSGSYPHPFFGNKGNAVLFASREGSVNPWSFQQDFAIALFVPRLANLSGHPSTVDQRHLRWASKRGVGTPTNGQKDGPVMILADTNQWNAGLPKPGTRLQSTAYVCTGTMAEVLAMLEELRGVDL